MSDRSTEKLEGLKKWFRERGSALIAFSGGVDSTFLLKVAAAVLGDRAGAATACSPTYPAREFEEARELAEGFGVKHFIIESNELEVPGYRENPPDRCYFCKLELFEQLTELAQEKGFAVVCDGSNSDDLHDHRPGRRAARELQVASPLAELGFTKEDIREESKTLELPTAEKPSFACLASRFPYGEEITAERLEGIDQAEDSLRKLNLGQLRVRYHRTVARIEVDQEQFETILENAKEVVRIVKGCGFKYVTMDLEGYRTGSMNETLSPAEKNPPRKAR